MPSLITACWRKVCISCPSHSTWRPWPAQCAACWTAARRSKDRQGRLSKTTPDGVDRVSTLATLGAAKGGGCGECGLFTKGAGSRVYRVPGRSEFEAPYRQDRRYVIFSHQAILSGILMASLPRNAMQELPPVYNYPLHLYAEDTTGRRPSALEELVTCRYEGWADLASLPLPSAVRYGQWPAQPLG